MTRLNVRVWLNHSNTLFTPAGCKCENIIFSLILVLFCLKQQSYPFSTKLHSFSLLLISRGHLRFGRVLLERLIVNRPHPWGLLVTFIELIKNPVYKFWSHEFVKCAPEIERLFDTVARSCNQGRTISQSIITTAPPTAPQPQSHAGGIREGEQAATM